MGNALLMNHGGDRVNGRNEMREIESALTVESGDFLSLNAGYVRKFGTPRINAFTELTTVSGMEVSTPVVVKMSDAVFVAIYLNSSAYLVASILTMENNVLTVKSTATIEGSSGYYHSVNSASKHDSDRIIFTYHKDANLYARVINISNGSIVLGTRLTIATNYENFGAHVVLANNPYALFGTIPNAIVLYAQSDSTPLGEVKCVGLTISTNTLTAHARIPNGSSDIDAEDMCLLKGAEEINYSAILFYRDYSSGYGTVCNVGLYGGTDDYCDFTRISVFSATNVTSLNAIRLSETKYVVAYDDYTATPSNNNCRVVNRLSESPWISLGVEKTVFNSTNSLSTGIAKLTENTFIYTKGTKIAHCRVNNDDTISVISIIESSEGNYDLTSEGDNDSVLQAYFKTDTTNSRRIRAISVDSFCGIAKQAGIGGETILIKSI